MGYLDQLAAMLQGASNSAAGTISAPVDGISWVLRKAGLGNVIGPAPVGGSDWMAQNGLTQHAPGLAGLAGETLGNVLPIAAGAKAPQLAAALLKGGENLAAPAALGLQRGVIDTKALAEKFPGVDFSLMQKSSGADATLSKVVVPATERGQGTGSAFMAELAAAADADKARLLLTPATDFGATSKGRLVDFYKRFGFVPNVGKYKDFTTMESMYREPK